MTRIVQAATLLVASVIAFSLPSLVVASEPLPQRGVASYYHPRFTGRPMANGERFNPNSNSAAHRTLPLGTVALVTNLSNGVSSTVVIEDRGPHIRGRILDVSPRTADELGMRRAGIATVEVRPVRFPDQQED